MNHVVKFHGEVNKSKVNELGRRCHFPKSQWSKGHITNSPDEGHDLSGKINQKEKIEIFVERNSFLWILTYYPGTWIHAFFIRNH